MNLEHLQFDENGLIPAIVQDAASKDVLTLAYMDRTSLEKTLATGETWFYSRSRQALWHKGETSGHTQTVKDLRFDCDQDALVVLVEPKGPACHTGAYSCFNDSLIQEEPVPNESGRYSILNQLESVIASRETERPEGAYTTYLFTEGIDKILKKVGEEASEVIIAAKNRSVEEMEWEVSDLIFHVLVLLREQNISIDQVLATLKVRHQ
ncbi:bifunctional phosphoribosyl-AMP cyclohydrolase/phosphoribosyl-ATP diphosphatase HisIE [Tuberibacillus sp. Marseille-P3662]|uniref:bifunctional phosphoribosyl-AMP cyclohydrolase/phosphoribosyl-ATP diphosphatase HisIE n=1 Tax=Tuberibacillus sp. Marseille-P3662 TaxID=1965358 RepID=UPI000A1CA774|nr:bifunctional phosphoribosyl-AMP cyclohydrolase/phosphoribosyl-ATP diphosphatase HisIE [Tuberibacillus sp. Marseille-P3662]